MMCDQRGEEGKLVQRFMQMQITHAARMTPNAIRNFLNVLVDCTMKSYSLDEKLLQIVRLFTERLIFPRIPNAMNALVTTDEKDKCVILAKKMHWLRSLTPQQLDMPDELVPIGYQHKEYTPLFNPPGEYKPQASPVDNTPLIPHNEHTNVNTQLHQQHQQHSRHDNQGALVPVIPTSPLPTITPPTITPPTAEDSHHDDSTQTVTVTTTSASSSTSGDTLSVESAPLVEAQSPTTGAIAFQFPVSKPLAMFEQFPAQNKMTDDVVPTQMVDLTVPYADAINILTQLNHDLVPADMYFHCVQAVRQVFISAKQIAKTHRQREREQRAADIVAAHLNETNSHATETKTGNATDTTRRSSDAQSKAGNGTESHSTETPLADVLPSTTSSSEAASLLPAAGSASDTTDPVAATALQPVDDINLNADNLVPLMIWLVIHANVPNIHQYFGHIERFIPGDLRNFGEAGMCSSMVESAIYHVQNLTPETLYNSRTPNSLTELMSREDVPPPTETSFDTLSTSSLTTHVDPSSPISSLSNHSSAFDPTSPRREPYVPLDLISDNEGSSDPPVSTGVPDDEDEAPLIPTPTKVHAASDDLNTQLALDADLTTQEASLNVVHAHVTDHHLDGPTVASVHVHPTSTLTHNIHTDIRTHHDQPHPHPHPHPQAQVQVQAQADERGQAQAQAHVEPPETHSTEIPTTPPPMDADHTTQEASLNVVHTHVTDHHLDGPTIASIHVHPSTELTHHLHTVLHTHREQVRTPTPTQPTIAHDSQPTAESTTEHLPLLDTQTDTLHANNENRSETISTENVVSDIDADVLAETEQTKPLQTQDEPLLAKEPSIASDQATSHEVAPADEFASEAAAHIPTSDESVGVTKNALTEDASHVNPLDAFLADQSDEINEDEPPVEEEMNEPEVASSNPLDDFLANADDFDDDENTNETQ